MPSSARRRYVYGEGMDEPLVEYSGTGLSTRRFLHADERGSIVAVTDDAGANGQVQTLVDAENNRTTYEYHGHDRLAKMRYPLPTKGANASSTTDYEQLTYDAGSNVMSLRNRAGETIGFGYDNLSRLSSKDLPGAEPDVTYSYDLLGRMTAAQGQYALSFGHDALGRKTSESGPHGTTTSAYDLASRRTRITYRDGFFVDQDYLVTGELSKVRENGATSGAGVLASFGYDTLGRRTGLTRGNGTCAGEKPARLR